MISKAQEQQKAKQAAAVCIHTVCMLVLLFFVLECC